jgi:alpha-methylacyl-CoA racemase
MEKLGLGPEAALLRNPRLVYGRMTGWGQHGPLARTAGHDIAYIAITGALHSIREAGRPPVPPLNLVGDYGGGALYLVAGVLAALIETGRSGRGQIVDAAICDGAASMMSFFYSYAARGLWSGAAGENLLDGGAPYYAAYECKDGLYLAVGAIEPQFYAQLRAIAGLDDPAFDHPHDSGRWRELKAKAAVIFRTRTRDEWAAAFEGSDACVAPILSLAEAPDHPHLQARCVFIERDGVRQPAPAPRFSRTPSRAAEIALDLENPATIAAEWSQPASQ